MLNIPLTTPEGTCIGVLSMTKRYGEAFDRQDSETMVALAAPAAVAITNAQRRSQLQRDELTGLASRQSLMQYLGKHLVDPGKPVSVMMIDCDHFKQINDQFGHEAGNHVLTEIGQRLQSAVGDAGMAARLSGDEFAVALPGHDLLQAEAVKQRIHEVMQQPVSYYGVQIPARLSAGIATGEPFMSADAGTLLKAADAAMYTEKRGHHEASPGPRDGAAVDGWNLAS